MTKGKTALMASVAAIAFVASPAFAQTPTLEQRVQALEQQLAASQAKSDDDHTRLSTLEQNFNYASWTFDYARPTITTGDGRFSMAFRARFQFDQANFMQANPLTAPTGVEFKDLSSGTVVRRAFFGVEGMAFKDFWYELRFNGGGSDGGTNGATEGDPMLSLARVAYKGIDHFQINLGIIEPVFMFEGTTSSGQLMFMERPEIDNIAADTYGAGDARRGIEMTFQKQGMFKGDDNLVVSAAFTGGKTGANTNHTAASTSLPAISDEQTQALGRISYRAWSDGFSNLSFGVSGAEVLYSGAGNGTTTNQVINLRDRPQIREDGNRLIATGSLAAKTANMIAADMGFNWQNFFVGGEWAQFQVDRCQTVAGNCSAPYTTGAGVVAGTGHPTFTGYYVEGSWILTGETKTYTITGTNNEVGGFGAPIPSAPFSFTGDSWGAWELTARYSSTDLNYRNDLTAAQGGIFGGRETDLLFGVNWYLNRNVKLQINDNIVSVNKLSAPLSVPGTVQKGQNLNILGFRMQFTN